MSLDYDIINTDIAIIGGGTSGVIAALQAGRQNNKTLLIEKNPFLGGTSYGSLVIPFFTFHDKTGKKIISGIAQELIDKLKEQKASYGHIPDTIGVAYSLTPYDPEIYQITILKMLKESNVDILFNSFVYEVKLENKRIKEVTAVSKYKKYKIKAKIYIDATGDSDLAYFCGQTLIYEKELQPLTLIFKLNNIDYRAIINYMKQNPSDFHYETKFSILDKTPFIGVSGFFSFADQLKEKISRDRFLFFIDKEKKQAIVNTTRIIPEGKDLWTKSKYRFEAINQISFLHKFMKDNLPGFAYSYLSQIAPFIGIRESRKIKGIYTLKDEDVLNAKKFPDGVCMGGFAIDIHKQDSSIISKNLSKSYQIPYRAMLTNNLENVIFTGRNISAQKQAYASLRVSATAMALGQVSAIAANRSLIEKKSLQEINIKKLQKTLNKEGVIF